MPKIIVSLADAGEQEGIASALRLKRHAVSALPVPDASEPPKAVAERLAREKAQVAIMDYLPDDAFSVKVLQAAGDLGVPGPRFIFLLPDGVPSSHILMAVNEGASAILDRPVNMDALENYVERAVNGPARARRDPDGGGAREADISDLEKEAKSMKMQLASNRKLIAYLMSTPASGQHRSAMVVSDSAYQRDYLRRLLEDHGFQVMLAANSGEGLEMALSGKPRVVISDLEMEGMNGVEFCRDLKIVHKFMPCYFVICTANSERIDTVMAPGNGVDACVLKPSSESGNQTLIATVAMGLLL